MNDTIVLLIPCMLFGAVILTYSFANVSRLLLVHIVGRGIIDSVPHVTYAKIIASFSIAQLYSVLYIVIFAMFLYFKRCQFKSELLVPIAGYLFIAFLSTIFSNYWVGFAAFSLKWVYFYLLCMVALELGRTKSTQYIAALLIISSAYPLINQLGFSFIFGPKCLYGQPICSYIGSFEHESELASFILLFLMGASLGILYSKARSKALLFYYMAFGVGVISLVLNGYRTALIGFAAYLAYLYLANIKRIDPLISILIFLVGLAAFILITVFSYESIEVYVSDVITLLSAPAEHIDLDGDVEKTTLFSGRLYLFNILLFVFFDSGVVAYLVGIGPDITPIKIGTLAHNEFLSTIVELGVLGFIFFMWMLWEIWKIVKKANNLVLCAMYICILVTALATMPFHDTRSVILLAILIGIAKGMSCRKVKSGRSKDHQSRKMALSQRYENV